MAESSNELERHIHELKHDLRDNFSELEDKVKTSLDWRAQFDERPGTLLAVAFGGGILLSALLPRGRSRHRTHRESDENAKTIRPGPVSSSRPRPENSSDNTEVWSALKGAAIGAAAGKITEFIEEILPGFRSDSSRTQTEKSYDRPESSSGPTPWQKSNTATSV